MKLAGSITDMFACLVEEILAEIGILGKFHDVLERFKNTLRLCVLSSFLILSFLCRVAVKFCHNWNHYLFLNLIAKVFQNSAAYLRSHYPFDDAKLRS